MDGQDHITQTLEAPATRNEGTLVSASQRLPDVVAVIPAYNEERFIASVVLSALQHAGRVIVVDDGSTDLTAFVAESAGAQVLRQQGNQGRESALAAGVQEALRTSPRAVVCLNGDARHRVTDLPRMVDPVLTGRADVVFGHAPRLPREVSPRKHVAGQMTLPALGFAGPLGTAKDIQNGYRAFSPEAVQTLGSAAARCSAELKAMLALDVNQLRVTEIMTEPAQKVNHNVPSASQLVQVLSAVFGLLTRRRPLMYLSLPGVLMATVGLMLFLGGLMNSTHELLFLRTLLIVGGVILAVSGTVMHAVQNLTGRIRGEFKEAMQQLAVLELGRQHPHT